jgi:hypothetical protein
VHSAVNCEPLGEVQISKQACTPMRIFLGHLFPWVTYSPL